jgi:hypothetical protein
MIVKVHAPGMVSIAEPHRLDSLHVEVPVGTDAVTLASPSALGQLGFVAANGTYAWLDREALREAVAPVDRSADWETSFNGMIVFAESKGWVDDMGRLRAHIERS